jgi:hypothetical protein
LGHEAAGVDTVVLNWGFYEFLVATEHRVLVICATGVHVAQFASKLG